jgi:uncharacterized protein YlzI (FlbEa/FlbD family)
MKIKYTGKITNLDGIEYLKNDKVYEVTCKYPNTVFVIGETGKEIQVDDRHVEIVEG